MVGENRVPRGRPAGGEFAGRNRIDSDVELASPQPGSLEYRIAESREIAASHSGIDRVGGFDAVKVDGAGTLSFFRNGKLHNDSGPAKLHLNGRAEYRVDGKLHNDFDGPTPITERGDLAFHRQGKKINPPAADVQLVGLADGIRAGFYDIQWARHRGAELIGGDLQTFDDFYEKQNSAISERNRKATGAV